MNRPYDARLDRLFNNAISWLRWVSPDQFHEDNINYLSEKSWFSIEELKLKTPDEISNIIQRLK